MWFELTGSLICRASGPVMYLTPGGSRCVWRDGHMVGWRLGWRGPVGQGGETDLVALAERMDNDAGTLLWEAGSHSGLWAGQH